MIRLLVLGALVYGAVLAATAPATLTAYVIERFTKERLVLRDPIGTVWAGSGRLAARLRSGETLDLGPLAWRVRPWSSLELVHAGKTAGAEISLSGITLRHLDVQLPGALVASLDPALEALGPQGTVRISSEELRIGRDSVLGLAQVEWRDVRLARVRGLALGSHVARLRGGGGTVGIELASLPGPLQLKGGGSWDRQGGGFALSGSAEAKGGELGAFLRSVCAEYRDSRCFFRYARDAAR